MLTQAWNSTADSAVALLLHYIFDLGGHNARELVERWLRFYPANWVRLAAIEALYQGRYKAVSVEQILGIWQRRGQIQPHFNCEFERLVCGNIQPRWGAKQSYPLLPAIHSHSTAIAPVAPTIHGNNTDRAMERQTKDANQHVQPNDVNCYPDREKTKVGHKQLAGVTVVETAPHATSVTAENQASEREKQCRHDSPLERRISPNGYLPRSSSSHYQPPIRQFNPGTTKTSDFYTKLKAISQHS